MVSGVLDTVKSRCVLTFKRDFVEIAIKYTTCDLCAEKLIVIAQCGHMHICLYIYVYIYILEVYNGIPED